MAEFTVTEKQTPFGAWIEIQRDGEVVVSWSRDEIIAKPGEVIVMLLKALDYEREHGAK